MDYKDTLLMPKTDFQMKGNLPENEKIQRAKWDEMDLYAKLREKNKGKEPFVLHDGPPYANGDIHIGHAMNKILKDFQLMIIYVFENMFHNYFFYVEIKNELKKLK